MPKSIARSDFHAEQLEVACLRALAAGKVDEAFRNIDRRCRISPLPRAHHFVLRAETLSRMGDGKGAMDDITHVLELAPEDIQANRRLLLWADGAAQRTAAKTLIARDPDPAVLTDAMNVLHRSGARAVASLRVFDDVIAGWTAWDGHGAIELALTGEPELQLTITPDDAHPLAGSRFNHIASIELDRPRSRVIQRVSLAGAGKMFYSLLTQPNDPTRDDPLTTEPTEFYNLAELDALIAFTPGAHTVTVIVPVYRDFEATRNCLESLKRNVVGKRNRRAVVIDDASPEPEIKQYLTMLAKTSNFTVLTNATNLGFVGAVNRGLALTRTGDIILLNADTVVPPDLVDRLAATARSSPSIGTITPLSNNGEFTSFPGAYKSNPVSALATEIDRVTRRVNAGSFVDIPNGIGFCLYVTRRCLDEVGELSTNFQRGYLEDVDFCLRARERGFRNICDTSVYVTHIGSRSFRSEKRALVVQNLDALDIKFPKYRGECAAFMAADPLRKPREAIARALPPVEPFERLIVCGSGAVLDVVRDRARGLARKDKHVLIGRVERVPSGMTIAFEEAGGDNPQSLAFGPSEANQRAALTDYLHKLNVDRIEIADPAKLPLDFVELLIKLGRPVDVLIADAGWLCPRGTLQQPDGTACATIGQPAPCGSCAATLTDISGEAWRAHWASMLRDADHVLAPNETARTLLTRVLERDIALLGGRAAKRTREARLPEGKAGYCGIIPHGFTARELDLIRRIARHLKRAAPDLFVVILGPTLDDLGLMAIGNLFVSGPIEPDEYATAFRRHALTCLFLPTLNNLFGHPAIGAADRSNLPVAALDWTQGSWTPRPQDFSIEPSLGEAEIADSFSRWFTTRPAVAGARAVV
jgi:O-antigen biosynthesis protein